ncbi:MAG: hypothetical protein GDA37_08600 [Ekhidna sp.]|nr:hypothetical protein [Ekhidna sp.]
MLRQSGEDCYNAIIVILNLEGFSNIIHPQWLFFSSKHVCVHQRKLRESGEPFARCSVLQKTKVNPEGMQLS